MSKGEHLHVLEIKLSIEQNTKLKFTTKSHRSGLNQHSVIRGINA